MSYGTSETFTNTPENMVRALRETGVLGPNMRTILQGRKEDFANVCAQLLGVPVGAAFMLGSDGEAVFLVHATEPGSNVKALLVLKFTKDPADPGKASVVPYYLTNDTSATLKEYDAAPLFAAFDQVFLPDLLLASLDLNDSPVKH